MTDKVKPTGKLPNPITSVYAAAAAIQQAMIMSAPSGSHTSAPEGFKDIPEIVSVLVTRGMSQDQAFIAAVAGTIIAHGRQQEGFKVGDYVTSAQGEYGIIVNEWKGKRLLSPSPGKTWVRVEPQHQRGWNRDEMRKRRGKPPQSPDRPWEYGPEDWPGQEDIPEKELGLWDTETIKKVRGEFGSIL